MRGCGVVIRTTGLIIKILKFVGKTCEFSNELIFTADLEYCQINQINGNKENSNFIFKKTFNSYSEVDMRTCPLKVYSKPL